MTTARCVFVGSAADAELSAAVRATVADAGARVVDEADAAEAIVWLSKGEPGALVRLITPRTRWVQLIDAGVDAWRGSGVLDAGPTVTCARGCYATAVAEHALAMMLAGARRLPACARATSWEPSRLDGDSLIGGEVVIVGAGSIGEELIRLLAPFDCRITAVTRSGRPVAGAARSIATAGLDGALPGSAFVVVCAALTPETRKLIAAPQFARMSASAWLINVGRGELVDTDALVDALDAGTIRGAALDVADPEPLLATHRLWTHPRALITPHVANPKHLKDAAFVRRLRENTTRFIADAPLLGVVDPARGY